MRDGGGLGGVVVDAVAGEILVALDIALAASVVRNTQPSARLIAFSMGGSLQPLQHK
jgi:hypothetical protein